MVNVCVAILILKIEENMQHFWHIMLYYSKKGKNAIATQRKICAVYGEGAVTDQMHRKVTKKCKEFLYDLYTDSHFFWIFLEYVADIMLIVFFPLQDFIKKNFKHTEKLKILYNEYL